MPVPRIDRHLNDSQQDAEGREEALGALPVLLVLLHAVFKIRDAASIAVTHEAIHLGLEDIEVT
jgi:hypothetical protein